MEDGCIVRVIKDFLTINEGELCVTKGEYLQVLHTVDRHWVFCKLEHRDGVVPIAHITKQEMPDLEEFQNIYMAQCNMVGDENFPVKKGSLIVSLEPPVGDWFRGQALDGRVGTFQCSNCWEMDATNYRKNNVRSKVEKFAQVLHPMRAQLAEEMDLEKGQIVKIVQIIDKDWYRGESNGQKGIFPASFVRIIDSFPGDVPPLTADITMYLNASTQKVSRSNNDYMNTRNAFVGLEENLRALVPKLESSNVVFGSQGAEKKLTRGTSLIEEDDYFRRNLPPSYCSGFESHSLDVFNNMDKCSKGFQELSRNLSCLKENMCNQKIEEDDRKKLDYTKLSQNLQVFESIKNEKSLFNDLMGRQTHNSNKIHDDSNNNFHSLTTMTESESRYQNLSSEHYGYTGGAVDVRPYGVAKYNFVAQFENELSLVEGDMVYLVTHIDREWIEGELDGRRGIFPISYINIIVDCESSEPYKDGAIMVHENLVEDTYHKVLYTFQAQMDGDLSVSEGEVVRIKTVQNKDWVIVENSFGEAGLCPGNHLDPSPDYCGKALFDIERLLSYKQQNEKTVSTSSEPTNKPAPKSELKFFDPLCSPDDEMLKVEAELERRSRENLEYKISHARQLHQQRVMTTTSKEPTKRDLDSLISSNLSKIVTLQTCTKPVTRVDSSLGQTGSKSPLVRKINISDSILSELRGKQKVPPPRPSESPKLILHKQLSEQDLKSQSLPNFTKQQGTTKKPPLKATSSLQSSKLPPSKSPHLLLKKSAPTRPPPPPPPKVQARSTEPPRPPSPVPSQVESLYASVNKKDVRRGSLDNGPLVLPPLPYRPPRPPSPKVTQSPPTPPSEPPPEVLMMYKDLIVTSADVHAVENDGLSSSHPPETTLPKKSNLKQEGKEMNEISSSPMTPLRTTSQNSVSLSLKGVEHSPSFPPDHESPGDKNGLPPQIPPSLAARSSSLKSRSAHYTSVASEFGDSLTLSSLNHSYETLNMYESNDVAAAPRMPHRPAPPVPAMKQSSQVGLAKANGADVDAIHKFDNVLNKKKTRHPMSRKTLRQRKIHSLRRQIQIKEKMLEATFQSKEQLLKELDMYQEIAVAKGSEYDTLNQKMDNCQESIENLSDEIQRLQACLADEELRLEEDSVEESRRRAFEEQRKVLLEAQRLEDEHRQREERKRKNREQRDNVIGELVVTEREFCRDLKLTWQAFGLDTPAMLEQRGVDVATLFGNVADVIDISERFLDTLQEEVKSKSSPEEQMVGKCFLQHSETMKIVYTEYCINHDKAEQLLEKYDAIQEIQRMLQKGVETLQSQVSCFNMGSILIKPVQRILKYPLILNELIKCTEDSHRDRADLMDAVCIMSDVASFINESKRRKDIIDKYKSEEDKTISRKISKLNMHSIGKKSTRISTKFLSSIGIDPVNRDLDFDDYEKRFSFLIRAVQSFSADSQRFREQQHESVVSQYNIAETVAELYKDRVHMREVERFRTAHRNVISTYWNEFNSKVEPRVIRPLQTLLENLQGPSRLIQKRHDKQLDLQASTQKSEKNRDPTKTKSLNDEVDKCRANFEALNSQLLEQLPKLLEVAGSIFSDSVNEFVLLRKLFVGRVTKELLSLMDLPLLASTSGDILEVFLVKHSMVCNQLGRFSFSSKAFRPEDKKKSSQSLMGQQLGQKTHEIVPQCSSVRTMLRGKYAAAKLYQANQLYVPTDLLDIGISPGDLVGVIQKKDPMGSTKRWFVDNGLTQGFLPCHVLAPFGETFDQNRHEIAPITIEPLPATTETGAASPPPTVHSYDDVAEEQLGEEMQQEQTLPQQPVRKAPPVPKSEKAEIGKTEERSSHHSYEEISASEANSEPSQDLSPIYEEIHGGSRSSVSGSSCSSGSRSVISSGSNSNNDEANIAIQRGKFYYALYDFTATEATMLSLFRGQVVRVVHVSAGDWCYVEDRNSNKGYVPGPYLKLYTMTQTNVTTVVPNSTSTNNNNNIIEKHEEVDPEAISELPLAT